jgi:hypothetical protein
VLGLVRISRTCANADPYVWIGRRMNLSDLAGFMDPDGIDDSIVLPEVIKFLKDNENRSLDGHGLPFFVLHKAYKMRQIYKAAKSKVEQEPLSHPVIQFGTD